MTKPHSKRVARANHLLNMVRRELKDRLAARVRDCHLSEIPVSFDDISSKMAHVVKMKADLLDWEDGDNQPEILSIMDASEAAHGHYSFDILYHRLLG